MAARMGNLMLVLALAAVLAAAVAMPDTAPGGLRKLNAMDCAGEGCEGGVLEGSRRELQQDLNLPSLPGPFRIIPRDDKGRYSFSFGPLTLGAEDAPLSTGSICLTAMLALPMAVFALIG